jgi:hypothetical protein
VTHIKPGPELDLAVAKAIGVDVKSHLEVGIQWCPSADLNAAFEAADKANLFLELTRINQDTWMVEGKILGTRYATANTPALAICSAILILQKDTTMNEPKTDWMEDN